nr:MAG: hypothetical protein 2 [Gammacarmovirus sp.]
MDPRGNELGRKRSRGDESKVSHTRNGVARQATSVAIQESKQGAMGASVYIADKIEVQINFNF